MTAAARFAAAAVAAAAVAAAAPTPGAASAPTDADADAALEGELTVFAAASLTEAFDAIADAFTDAHPDVDVTVSYASSADLVGQIVDGAPADVFASADTATMDEVVDAGAAGGSPQTFATNSLAIIVEPGNPRGIDGLADLADDDLIVVSCDPAVPIGAYTAEVLAAAGVDVEFDSLEENVRSVAAKVQLGEADAGIVYITDVLAAGDAADGVAIDAELNVVAEYPIVTTAEADDPGLAAAFVEFVLGDDGQDVLAELAFGPPDAAPPATMPDSGPATSAPD